MVWNSGLAQSAYNWAALCPVTIGHSGTHGENLALWYSSSPTTYQSNNYSAVGVVGLQSLGSPGRVGGEPSSYTAYQGS